MSEISVETTEVSENSAKSRKRLTRKAKRIISLSLILSLLAALCVSIYVSNYCLKITKESIESNKVDTPIRLALISDMHTRSFGNNNEKLINSVAAELPDVILLAGDIVSNDSTEDNDFKYVHNLVFELSKIAPVYFSIGNHERFNPYAETICSFVRSAGGIILDEEYQDILIKGNSVRIGGLSYYRFWDEESNAYLQNFTNADKDTFTLLLCHNPEFYVWGIKNYNIDLIASGHTHGGMVKLPLLGPLYAPEQGWFPEYAAGLYESECGGHLAVTTGLGSSPEFLPRIFNRPEIMIIDVE